MHEPCLLGKQVELLRERRRHRGRNIDAAQGHWRRAGCAVAGRRDGPCELLEVERITASLTVELTRFCSAEGLADELVGLLRGESRELTRTSFPARCARSNDGRESLAQLPWPDGHRQQHRRGGRSTEERAEELHRRRIGPVDIIEQQYDGLSPREPLEEDTHGAVAAVALVLRCDLASAGERRQRREDGGQLRPYAPVEGFEPTRVEAWR